MSFYVAAYDTEPVYPWWENPEDGFSYTPERIDEFLDGVRAVAEVHLQREAPASFFLVAKMLELVGPELRSILDHPLFDIQCHTFTHPSLIGLDEDEAALRYELVDAKKLIEDTFGRAVIGLTAPGGYTHGFTGHPRILEVMWEMECGRRGAGVALLELGGLQVSDDLTALADSLPGLQPE